MLEKIKYLAKIWFNNYQLSTVITAAVAFLFSVGYIVYNGYLGAAKQSLWNGAICIYYIFLALIRAILLKAERNRSKNPNQFDEKKLKTVYIITHIMLLLMDISMIVPIAVMVRGERSFTFGLIPAIVLALYTFYRVFNNIFNYYKVHKTNDILISELRMISLTDAILSILTLQNALIIIKVGLTPRMKMLKLVTGIIVFIIIIVLTMLSFIKIKRNNIQKSIYVEEEYKTMNNLEIAKKICMKAHENQKDKGGNPYYLHPFTVASMCNNDDEKIVAYLHDVIEDTPMTLDELKQYGFEDKIINAVDAITHKDDTSYDDYVKIVKKNNIARVVKINDLIHNSDLTRLNNVTQKDLDRREKYQSYIKYLKETDK